MLLHVFFSKLLDAVESLRFKQRTAAECLYNPHSSPCSSSSTDKKYLVTPPKVNLRYVPSWRNSSINNNFFFDFFLLRNKECYCFMTSYKGSFSLWSSFSWVDVDSKMLTCACSVLHPMDCHSWVEQWILLVYVSLHTKIFFSFKLTEGVTLPSLSKHMKEISGSPPKNKTHPFEKIVPQPLTGFWMVNFSRVEVDFEENLLFSREKKSCYLCLSFFRKAHIWDLP